MQSDSASADCYEMAGVVVLKGVGVAGFTACEGRLSSYPIENPATTTIDGQLLCQLQAGITLGVGNRGDSRAVMGKYQGGDLWTIPLSRDHGAHVRFNLH